MFRILVPLFLGMMTTATASPLFSGRDSGTVSALQEEYRMTIRQVSSKIELDGQLTEAVWQNLPPVSSFWRKFPTDGGKGKRQTTVRTTFDDKFIYFGIEAFDSGKAFISTLKRDGGHDGSDGIGIILDPLNQRTNGFFFVVNAFNAQSEDQLSASVDGVNFSWDHKWFSATRRYDNKWVAEIAIPFKTLRYNQQQMIWGINFVRIDTKTNEYSTWTRMPVNFRSYDLGYTGALLWESMPPPSGSNIAFVPFVTGQAQSGNLSAGKPPVQGSMGFDAKVGLSTALNLDLTVNPDFSQIEVDRQVTNLTRFNIFLPERRTFFLENADLFAGYGIPPIRPFYSRRIGLDNNGNAIPILGGIRLSGNLTSSTRIGLMNMHTGNKGSYRMENFTAATVHQRVLKRSVIKAYGLNRQGFPDEATLKKDPLSAWGRNAGIEFNYSNTQGTWQWWSAYHRSFKPGIRTKDAFIDLGLSYNVRKFNAIIDFVSVGTNYYTDMGFVERILNYDAGRDTMTRLGFRHLFTQTEYIAFPKKGKINSHRISWENYTVFNPNGSFNETNQQLQEQIQFSNTGALNAGMQFSRVHLLFPTAFTKGTPLPAGTYSFFQPFASYSSDFRKMLAFSIRASAGGFYNGDFRSVRATLTFRNPPHVSVALQAEYNRLAFPADYGKTSLLLISPRVDFNINTSIFWTTFLQYNTQANNFNVNSRFQWRFRPMSDLYLVYTDNYFTTPFMKNKNRALVLKFSYWITV